MEKEKKEIKISLWTFYVLVAAIVVLVGAVVIGALNVQKQQNNKQNGETVGNNEQGQQQVADVDKVEQLNVNSELVQKLYSYVSYIEPRTEMGFYRNEKMTESNLDEDLKLLTVLYELLEEKKYTIVKESDLRLEQYTVQEGDYGYYTVLDIGESYWYDYEMEQYVKQEPQTISVIGDVYEFNMNRIQEKAKLIFNENLDIQKHSIDLLGEVWVYDEGMYKLVQVPGGGGFLYTDISDLVKAESIGNEIHIYDNYIRMIENWEDDNEGIGHYVGNEIFASSDKKIKIVEIKEQDNYYETLINEFERGELENFEKKLNTILPQYKHTFKQADNGEYYWVSTELINKADLPIIK